MSDKSTDHFKRKNLDQNDPIASGKMKKCKLTKEESDLCDMRSREFDYCLKTVSAEILKVERNKSLFVPNGLDACFMPDLSEQLKNEKSFNDLKALERDYTLKRGYKEMYEKYASITSERNNLQVIDDEDLFMHWTMERNDEMAKVLPGRVNFKILGQNSALMHCRMKINKRFRKMMNIYADSVGIQKHVLNFRYDGEVVGEADTPYSLRIREGDTIEVYQRMTGGRAKIDEMEAADSSTVI